MTDLTPRTGPDDTRLVTRPSRPWFPIVVLGLVLFAGGVIVTQFLRSAVDYYCNVDEVGVRSGCDADRRLRVQGLVEQGSVETSDGDTDFVISFNGVTLPVHYDGQPGGIFKECIPVIVHGRFDGAAKVFLGDLVEVKHSNEYVAVNDKRISAAEAQAEACDTGTI